MYRRVSARRLPWMLPWMLLWGCAAAASEPPGIWQGDPKAPVPASLHGGRVVHARDVEALIRRGGAVIIDVSSRPLKPAGLAPGAPWLPLAHRALPGAQWLPGTGEGVLTPAMDAFYRDRLRRATAGDAGTPLVVYCHERCWLSWNAAKRAIGYGYRRVSWFADGIEGWSAAGLPTQVVEPQSPVSPTLVVLDIELTGDLGGPEFTAEHAARLVSESARLRDDLGRTGLYTLVDARPAADLIARLESQQAYLHDCNGCDLDIGRRLNADLVLVAWVNRVSGLILTLTYEIHDVKTGQITARKSFDFRGDSDNAWNHAVDYMVRDLQTAAGATPGA